MRTPKLWTAVVPVTLLAIVALTGTAHADYRTAEDRCNGPQTHLAPSQRHNQALQCNAVFEIPPHRTWADPISEKEGRCPGSSYMVNEGAWEYWTYRGEWVTWNGWFREAPHLGSDDEALSRRTFFVAPYYHNWSSWDWPTRTIETCAGADRYLAKVAAVRVAEPDPDRERGSALSLGAGDDVDRGTNRDDVSHGGGGDDALFGEEGDDQLLGGRGADRLWGGEGSDELFDDRGRDRLYGGDGDDRFSTRDGNRDVVACGAGEDVAIGDPRDAFRDCEHVYTTPENTPDRPPTID